MKNTTTLSVLVMLSVAACGVKNRQVDNKPPKMVEQAAKFSQETGVIEPMDTLSVFYWPEGMQEKDIRAAAKAVNTASRAADKIEQQMYETGVKKKTIEIEFEKLECSSDTYAEFKDMSHPDDNTTIEWVTEWKAADSVPEDKRANLETCKKLQADREPLIKALYKTEEVNGQKKLSLKDQIFVEYDKIFRIVDPETYPKDGKQVNYKKTSAATSRMVLRPTDKGVSVELTFSDFVTPSNVQTTDTTAEKNVARLIRSTSYDLKTKMLKFVVPEMGEDGLPTGAELQFSMERAPDLAGNARFMGDVNLVKNGKVLRYGSAKIAGKLKPLE